MSTRSEHKVRKVRTGKSDQTRKAAAKAETLRRRQIRALKRGAS